jgi:hypothetical protein
MRSRSSNDASRSWPPLILTILSALVVLLGASRALAAAPDPNRVVVYVEGTDAKYVRQDILSALPDTMKVADLAKTEAALKAAGIKGRLPDVLEDEGQRKKVAPKLAKVATRLGAAAILVANVPKRKGDRDIAVLVVRDKTEVSFETVTIGKKEGSGSRATKWQSLFAATLESDAAPEPERASQPEPVAKKEKTEEAPAREEPREEPEEKKEAVREPERDSGAEEAPAKHPKEKYDHAMAVVGVAYDAGTRGFSYKDPVTNNLRPYNVTNTPGIAASLEVYPLARSKSAILPDLALTGRMARAFAFDSGTSSGQDVATTWQDVEIGLRGRIHTGTAGKAPLLGAGIAFVSSVFDFGSSPAARDLPSARYKMLRLEFDGRIPIDRFAVLVGASYLPVFSAAPMTDRFPRASTQGVGGRLGVAARALPWLEGRLELKYDHFFYRLSPEPGDAYVAGGALDQRLAITAGAYAFF